MIALRFDQRLVRPKKYIGEIEMPSPCSRIKRSALNSQTGFNQGLEAAVRP